MGCETRTQLITATHTHTYTHTLYSLTPLWVSPYPLAAFSLSLNGVPLRDLCRLYMWNTQITHTHTHTPFCCLALCRLLAAQDEQGTQGEAVAARCFLPSSSVIQALPRGREPVEDRRSASPAFPVVMVSTSSPRLHPHIGRSHSSFSQHFFMDAGFSETFTELLGGIIPLPTGERHSVTWRRATRASPLADIHTPCRK